jgi:hypothetical protein
MEALAHPGATPRRLWLIALAAAAPFPLAAALYAYGADALAAHALTVLLSWSAVVLGFLGGVRWGMEAIRPAPRAHRLAGSILSPAFGWGLLFARDALGLSWILGGFAAAFILQWLFDHTAPDVPARYPRLLTLLTGVACVSLALALEQALSL